MIALAGAGAIHAGLAAIARARPLDAPLDPDEDEARRLLLIELGKPEYEAARPTWWDRLMHEVGTWLDGLFAGDAPGVQSGLMWIALLAGLLLLAGIAWLVLRNVGSVARSEAADARRAVFLDDDRRSARELRDAAEAAARAGRWPLAVAEQYRALARSLSDRTIIALDAGATAGHVAHLGGLAFPARRQELIGAGAAFDRARYLDLPASEDEWRRLRALDEELERTSPEHRAGLAELAAARGAGR